MQTWSTPHDKQYPARYCFKCHHAAAFLTKDFATKAVTGLNSHLIVYEKTHLKSAVLHQNNPLKECYKIMIRFGEKIQVN